MVVDRTYSRGYATQLLCSSQAASNDSLVTLAKEVKNKLVTGSQGQGLMLVAEKGEPLRAPSTYATNTWSGRVRSYIYEARCK